MDGSEHSRTPVFDLHSLQQALQSVGNDQEIEIEELIKTRKEVRKVKTEEKRKETLKLLAEVKLRNDRESREKLFRLPDEIWEQILSLVARADPKDLSSMWGVHPKFRQLSGESQSQECLLSQVLSIKKLPYLWVDGVSRSSKFKKFRRLSKNMRSGVQSRLEEDFMTILRSPESRPKPPSRFSISADDTKSLDKIFHNFCSVNGKAKLVFHRSIEVSILPWSVQRRERYDEFTQMVTSLLEKVGDQIWYFRFVVDVKDELFRMNVSMDDVYILWRQWVSSMMNLKWLEVVFSYVHSESRLSQETLRSHPFPHVENLERIGFGSFLNVQTKKRIVSSVIERNLQVKVLDLCGFDDKEENRLFFWEMKPLLSMLKPEVIIGNFEWTRSIMGIMQIFTRDWKLKSFAHCFDRELLDLGEIFNFLNKIPTLEQLSLHSMDVTVGASMEPLRLPKLNLFELDFNLRSVNYASVENVINFTSLCFLVNCEKLRTLKWLFTARNAPELLKTFRDFLNKHERMDVIHFKCGYGDLRETNVWDMFPDLECARTRTPGNEVDDGKIREIRKSRLFMQRP